jgi:hypothetical protein
VTILAFGGEMGFFLPSDSNAAESTANGYYNGSFARGYTGAHGPASYIDTPALSAQANLWFHLDIQQTSPVTSSPTLVRLIEFLDSGGIAQLRLTGSWLSAGGDGVWQMEHWTGTAWSALGSCNAAASSLQTLDIHIVSNTSSGSVNLYMSGTLRITESVNLSTLSGITKARCWGISRGISSTIAYSQMVLATVSTIGMQVGTIYMSGQGTTHTFDTGGYTNVDELVTSDVDFIQSGTAGQIELFTGTSIPSFTGYSIKALAITARAKSDGSAPAHFRFQLRSAGATYDNGADLSLDFGYGNYCAVWETNPATSAAFQPSEISALQYGVKSVT